MNVNVIGIDIAKHVFHIHCVDKRGKCLKRKKVNRMRLIGEISKYKGSTVVMEACGGASYWGREFQKRGFQVKLIAPQFVKPYVKSNKNDWVDAEAICEAAQRPNMRFVSVKAQKNQDIQSIHRIRRRIIRCRTALSNEIRGLLLEYGITINKGVHNVPKALTEIISESERLSIEFRDCLQDLYDELVTLNISIKKYDNKLKLIAKQSETCKSLMKVTGIAHIGATAFVAAVGDPSQFKNGRQCSAWLGVVPKQSTTGGKPKLLGISKRGDKYLRSIFILGAKGAIVYAKNRDDKKSLWIKSLLERKGHNKTAVAIANKNIRTAWAIMAKGQQYNPDFIPAAYRQAA